MDCIEVLDILLIKILQAAYVLKKDQTQDVCHVIFTKRGSFLRRDTQTSKLDLQMLFKDLDHLILF